MSFSYPSHIWIEPTSRCNTKCKTCMHYVNDFGIDLPESLFRKIEEQVFENLTRVSIVGYGEPLMAESFLPILNACIQRGIEISTTTNGILLNEAMVQRLILADTDLTLSVDGTTADVFQSIRPFIKFEKIIRVLKRIKESRKQNPNSRFSLSFNMVVMKRNHHQLPDMVKLAARNGVKRLTLFNFIYNSQLPEDLADETLDHCLISLRKHFKEAENLAADLGIIMIYPDFFNSDSPERETKATNFTAHGGTVSNVFPDDCSRPWNDCYFSATGDVMTCCNGGNSLGNIKTEDFQNIWNGDRYNFVRQTIGTNNPPPHCRTCNIPGGITRGNKLFMNQFLSENLMQSFSPGDRNLKFFSRQENETPDPQGDSGFTVFTSGGQLLGIKVKEMAPCKQPRSGKIKINSTTVTRFKSNYRQILAEIPEDCKEARVTIEMDSCIENDFSLNNHSGLAIQEVSLYRFNPAQGHVIKQKPRGNLLEFMKQKLQELQIHNPQEFRTLIFCASGYGPRVGRIAQEAGFQVIGFTDNSPDLHGRMIQGLPVVPPSEILSLKLELIIIASLVHASAILAQCLSIVVGRDILIIPFTGSSFMPPQGNKMQVKWDNA